jgi:hypothetical protein
MDNVDRIFLTFGICVIQARQAGTVVEHWKVGEGEVAYANSRVSHGVSLAGVHLMHVSHKRTCRRDVRHRRA